MNRLRSSPFSADPGGGGGGGTRLPETLPGWIPGQIYDGKNTTATVEELMQADIFLVSVAIRATRRGPVPAPAREKGERRLDSSTSRIFFLLGINTS